MITVAVAEENLLVIRNDGEFRKCILIKSIVSVERSEYDDIIISYNNSQYTIQQVCADEIDKMCESILDMLVKYT